MSSDRPIHTRITADRNCLWAHHHVVQRVAGGRLIAPVRYLLNRTPGCCLRSSATGLAASIFRLSSNS